VLLGAVDATNHLWAPPVGGGAATIASAAGVTDIWANSASSITISGTNTITALANSSATPGTVKVVTASGAFTLTHNATSLELPSGANITVAAGDRFLAVAKSSTNVAVFAYTKADGSAITNPSVPIGTTLYGEWATIPVKTVYKVGQALARATYPDYFNAMSRVQTGTLTSGNNTITALSNNGGLGAGMPIEGIGIQAGTTVVSVTSSTIVMSNTATANGSQTIRVITTGYGSGGDSTTVGVTDCRGRVMAGRDDQLIGAANRLTPTYFGRSASVIANADGDEKQTLLATQIPAHSHPNTLTDPGHGHAGTIANNIGGITSHIQANVTGSGISLLTTATGSGVLFTIPSAVTSMSINNANNTGGGLPHPIVQPTSIAECVVVVLP
jgi:microcystin-dependent protein